jgi:hypothetical protein
VPDMEEMFKRADAVTVNSSRIMLLSCYPLFVVGCWRGTEADECIGR